MTIENFEPERVLGKGAMGAVWRGHYRPTGQPVAVKILGDREISVKSFGDELRALARLDHPGIVKVYDWGHLGPEASRWGAKAGQGYLVLELAEGRPLREIEPENWFTVRAMLSCILAGLAHAHARGVIHRDLKPANLAIEARSGAMSLDARLLDFGIAALHNVNPEETAEMTRLSGTPSYMAPEQIQGNRKIGPWTDLYAIGCLAYRLVTGETPFTRENQVATLSAQVRAPMPPVDARFPVPEDFEHWCAKMLQKSHLDRFESAADAAFALSQMPLPGEPVVRVGGEPGGDDADGETVVFRRSGPSTQPVQGGVDGRFARAPIPRTWHGTDRAERAAIDPAASLRLFHIRRFPIAGREAEQGLLWNSLLRTQSEGAQSILIRGDGGVGKTRLATWLGGRAEELAGVPQLLLRCGGGREALGLVLRRFFGVHPKKGDGLELVRSWFSERGPFDADSLLDSLALTDVMFPAAAPESRSFSDAEVADAFAHFIERIGRPTVMIFDDLETDRFALKLAERVVALDAPALVLMTARPPGGTQPEAEAVFEGLKEAGVRVLRLDNLDVEGLNALISSAVKLSDHHVSVVHQKTAGNPLYTLKMLGDWVDRDLLEVRGESLHLKVSDPPLGETLGKLLKDQVSFGLDGPREWAAAELAAVLGPNFSETVYLAALQEAGLSDLDIISALAERGVLVRQGGWLRFRGGMTRDVLIENAAAFDRTKLLHAACARALARWTIRRSAHYGVIGEHYMAASAWGQAADAFLRAAAIDDFYVDIASQRRFLDRYEAARALTREDEQGWSPGDLQESTLLRLQARQLANQGKVDEARELTRECLRLADASGDPSARAHAHFMACQLGIPDDLEHGRRACELFEASGNTLYLNAGLLFHAGDLESVGRHEEALRVAEKARALARRTEEWPLLISALMRLAILSLSRGDTRGTRGYIDEARRHIEANPDYINIAGLNLVEADLNAELGSWSASRSALEQTAEAARRRANGHLLTSANLRLAALHLHGGALEMARAAVAEIAHWRDSALGAGIHTIDAALAVLQHDSEALDVALEALEAMGEASRRPTPVPPLILEFAAENALNPGERDRIRAAAALWWKALDRPERVARLLV